MKPLDLRAAHPTDCTCEACEEETARELATTFHPAPADPRRVVVAGRLARAVRALRVEQPDERKRSA